MAGRKRSDEDLDRELIEFLNELRVALPGVQVLFAFLLAVPFANGWKNVTPLQRDVFFFSFICTAGATAMLIAPSAHHRLLWREGDKEHLLTTANRLTIAGLGLLALAISGSVFLITDILFDLWEAVLVTVVIGAVFGWLWYGLPLLRRARQ